MNIPELLQGRRICVCAGSGGVGKTTTSAAIGLGMAALGLRVCVITIDPARRLATALGLDELSNTPSRVGTDRLATAGLEVRGELWAMMLDPKATFDEFIDATAPSAQQAAAVKANPIYQGLSSAVAGSQEFTAVSKLHDLAGSGRFDLLVLDTPPARNALDFLDAPRRLVGFLEGRALQALMRPTGVGVRLLSVGAGPLLAGLRRITGVDLVSDITTFFTLLGPMGSAFSARAASVETLLASPQTAFVLVASAQRASIDEALWFARTLAQRRLPFAGVVVNRFHHDLGGARSIRTRWCGRWRPGWAAVRDSPIASPPPSPTSTAWPGGMGPSSSAWRRASTASRCSPCRSSTRRSAISPGCCGSTPSCSAQSSRGRI